MLRRVRITVRGLVQGVGFRAYIANIARRLGLKGFVKNLDDGSVLIVAEGEEESLAKLIDAARRGPPAAIVESVDVVYEDYRGDFDWFYIDYD